MLKYRSLNAKAAHLQASRVIRVSIGPDGIEVSGCDPIAEQVMHDSLVYDARGRLRIHPESLVAKSGVQVRIAQEVQSV
jgi:hypothetical protein